DGIRDRNVTGVQTCALPIYGVGETETACDAEVERTDDEGDDRIDLGLGDQQDNADDRDDEMNEDDGVHDDFLTSELQCSRKAAPTARIRRLRRGAQRALLRGGVPHLDE